MKQYFKDFYGATASITETRDGSALLRVCSSAGALMKKSTHKSVTAARSAMQRTGDG